jgi:hypothetical protein
LLASFPNGTGASVVREPWPTFHLSQLILQFKGV